MTDDDLDPVIHAPARLRIVVTLAALTEGDNLSFTRLQDLIGLTPGNLITHLRKLEDAGYVATEKKGSGVTARTSVALTSRGREALARYKTVLQQLLSLGGLGGRDRPGAGGVLPSGGIDQVVSDTGAAVNAASPGPGNVVSYPGAGPGRSG
jgi:DNA-binding MarR family transcriptional regulator